MAKKKQKQKEKIQKTSKGKVEDFKVEVGETRSDVKTFIEKFRSDVERKKKAYQLYAQKFRKKK